jgi:hypothetical protein
LTGDSIRPLDRFALHATQAVREFLLQLQQAVEKHLFV